ncbi:MAG TPA: hypothetical protein VK517_00440 [Cyclobacteriaceae bacterium]|nr:hypothetical protein [Cyclobacteriaceae bacterium]
MNLVQYPFTSNREFLEFTFYSEGPHGNIEKRIRFKKIYGHHNAYNLAFGDLDPKTGEISDSITTDNKDTDKVLATVASANCLFWAISKYNGSCRREHAITHPTLPDENSSKPFRNPGSVQDIRLIRRDGNFL